MQDVNWELKWVGVCDRRWKEGGKGQIGVCMGVCVWVLERRGLLPSTGVRQLQQQRRMGKQQGHCSHTHQSIPQQVWPGLAHVKAGSSVSMISSIAPPKTSPPSQKQHLIHLIRPCSWESALICLITFSCYLIRARAEGSKAAGSGYDSSAFRKGIPNEICMSLRQRQRLFKFIER